MKNGKVLRNLMSANELDAALTTIANAIDENNKEGKLILVGIRERGAPLAERLAEILRASKREVEVGILDITLYRDDLSEIGPVPMVGQTDITFNINGLPLILVDDVLHTGRTIRAAMDCLNDFGRPKHIQLAVLVDRGGRELPIAANYYALNITTGDNEHVKVKLTETDDVDGVFLQETISSSKKEEH
jgi:pyrimidine operon attenuation protein/uracil phosphoribosyltransferase